MPAMHQNPYHPPQNAFANVGHPYVMQSASPHGHLYGYDYKSPSYAMTKPCAVSPLPSSYAMANPMADVRLATSGPHHGPFFRDLSAPFVALSAERQLADLQRQNSALKKELEIMKKAANEQLFTVIYYLASIDSMIRLFVFRDCIFHNFI